MNTDREDLRLLITEFNDGPMGSADDFAWRRHLKTYEDLLAEVKRLRKTIEDIEATAQDYDHPEVEEIISICMSVMERDSVGYNSDIPWNNVHSGDD